MKRFTKTLVAVMIIAATGAAIMVGCKKEESALQKEGVAQTDQSISKSEQKIIDFLADFSAIKQGVKAEGEAVKPEVARWQIEKAFNYCYSFTEDQLSDMRQDVVSVAMPKVNAEGAINYGDLLEAYGNVVDAVREAYKAIELEGKTLKFVTISIGKDETKNEDSFTILMNTGSSRGIDPGIPPVSGCFIWGTLGSFEIEGSAVSRLQSMVNHYDDSLMLYYNPCASCYTYLDTLYTYAKYKGDTINDLFYASGLTMEQVQHCMICEDELDDEYNYIISLGHPGQPTNLYGCDWYYCTVISSDGNVIQPYAAQLYQIWHQVEIKHCIRRWRQHGGEYPMPIDEEQSW